MFFLNAFHVHFCLVWFAFLKWGLAMCLRDNLKILGSSDPLILGSQVSRTISPPMDPKQWGPSSVSQSLLCDMLNLFSELNLFFQVRMTTIFMSSDKVASFKNWNCGGDEASTGLVVCINFDMYFQNPIILVPS